MQPISVTLLQTALTFHSHKIGDGLFVLLVTAAVAEWSYTCQSTNPIDVYPLTAVPACCIISASDVPPWKNSSCSLKINLFCFCCQQKAVLKKKIIRCIMLLQYVKLWSIKKHFWKISTMLPPHLQHEAFLSLLNYSNTGKIGDLPCLDTMLMTPSW